MKKIFGLIIVRLLIFNGNILEKAAAKSSVVPFPISIYVNQEIDYLPDGLQVERTGNLLSTSDFFVQEHFARLHKKQNLNNQISGGEIATVPELMEEMSTINSILNSPMGIMGKGMLDKVTEHIPIPGISTIKDMIFGHAVGLTTMQFDSISSLLGAEEDESKIKKLLTNDSLSDEEKEKGLPQKWKVAFKKFKKKAVNSNKNINDFIREETKALLSTSIATKLQNKYIAISSKYNQYRETFIGKGKQLMISTANQMAFTPLATNFFDKEGHRTIINLSTKPDIGNDKYPKSDRGFKVIDIRKGEIKFDILKDKKIDLPFLPIGDLEFGLDIVAGLTWATEKHVRHYSSIESLPTIGRIPTQRSDFDKWAVNDSLTYRVHGKMAVHLGIGITILNGAILAEVNGSWTANIRKTSENTIQVAYTQGLIGDVKLPFKKMLKETAESWYLKHDEMLSYEFNLSKNYGWDLYIRMIHGDVKTVKAFYLKELVSRNFLSFAKKQNIFSKTDMVNLAGKKWLSRIRYDVTFNQRQMNKLKEFFSRMTVKMIVVGSRHTSGSLSFQSKRWPFSVRKKIETTKKETIIEKSYELGDGVFGKSFIGLYELSKLSSGVFSKKMDNRYIFGGNIQRILILNPTNKPSTLVRFSGFMKYVHKQPKWSRKTWKREMNRLSSILGFKEILSTIPAPYKKNAINVQLTADLLLSQKTISGWMAWALKNTSNRLIRKVEANADLWFNNNANNFKDICNIDNLEKCKIEIYTRIDSSARIASQALKRMALNLPTGKESVQGMEKKLKEFASIMADFGEGILNNQFVLKTFLDIARKISGGDQHLVVQWQGENIGKGERVIIPSSLYTVIGNKVIWYKKK